MDNERIASRLNQLADLLEFTGANAFRLRAYRKGARVIQELTDSISAKLESGEDLTKLEGIGKGVAQKCVELCETGKLKQLDEILEQVPKSVLDLLNIPKLGPKKAAALFNELNITTLDQLKEACHAKKVRELSGFGAKTEEQILEGISIAAAANTRILWQQADGIVSELREHMSHCPAVGELEFAGSYRRRKETVGDLDMLVTSESPESVMDHFGRFPRIRATIARGSTKMSVRFEDEFQVDLRVVPDESFGAALQYFTGSKEHNVEVRGRAKQLGLRINEWGVYRAEDNESETSVAGKTETEVYQQLNLPVIPPELREARQEFRWAEAGELPELVDVAMIRGDLHMHTVATDGKNTIEEMAQAAQSIGLDYIAITDHSKRVSMANGLDETRLLDQWRAVDEINQQQSNFIVLKGIECDILESGEMDLPDSILEQADWVIASVHYGQRQPKSQITDRITGALENPNVDIVAHPTGRLINKRPPYEVDMGAVFQAAKENGKFLELNASPKRLDLNDQHLIAAKAAGVPIVISTDAHRTAGLSQMKYGINQARRAGLTAADVVNTLPWPQLKAKMGST